MAATLFLSDEGHKALGSTVFRRGRSRRRDVTGSILGYQAEGVWFQDRGLLRSGEMVLIKWNLIDAILSEAPTPEPIRSRAVGFQTRATE
jgi:uncharacterized protein YfaS (alpha-2-macroglobulin family)